MKNSDFSLNTYSLGIERAKNLAVRKAHGKSPTSQRRNRYRGHPPCRKVVRLARVPYYARPRLTPFLSAHVSLGSGSIRRALADVSPSLPPLRIHRITVEIGPSTAVVPTERVASELPISFNSMPKCTVV